MDNPLRAEIAGLIQRAMTTAILTEEASSEVADHFTEEVRAAIARHYVLHGVWGPIEED
jgi:hypothetical protein